MSACSAAAGQEDAATAAGTQLNDLARMQESQRAEWLKQRRQEAEQLVSQGQGELQPHVTTLEGLLREYIGVETDSYEEMFVQEEDSFMVHGIKGTEEMISKAFSAHQETDAKRSRVVFADEAGDQSDSQKAQENTVQALKAQEQEKQIGVIKDKLAEARQIRMAAWQATANLGAAVASQSLAQVLDGFGGRRVRREGARMNTAKCRPPSLS